MIEEQSAEGDNDDMQILDVVQQYLEEELPPEVLEQFDFDRVAGILEAVDGAGISDAADPQVIERVTEAIGQLGTAKDGISPEAVEQLKTRIREKGLFAALHPEPIRREGARIGRNDPCPCGCGKKYKKCPDRKRK